VHKILIPAIALTLFSCGGNSEENKTVSTESKDKKMVDTTSQVEQEEKFESGLKISFKTFASEKCFEADPEDEYGEPFCAERKVKQMLVALTDAAVAEKINATIFKSITDKPMGSISMKKWVSQIQQLEGIYEAAAEEINCITDLQNEYLLCMSVSAYSYSYGAAHGSSGIVNHNFDLKTGKDLQLNDLLKEGYKKELKRLGEKIFLKTNGSEGWDFRPGKGDFFLPDNFSITKKGLLFTYGQYEIGPYAVGSPQVLIRYDQLLKFIPEDSYLTPFVQTDQVKK
jgi:hypothetical protein